MSSETEETPQFSPLDLPLLEIQSDFESSVYSDADQFHWYLYTIHSCHSITLSTPATTFSQLAANVLLSYFPMKWKVQQNSLNQPP